MWEAHCMDRGGEAREARLEPRWLCRDCQCRERRASDPRSRVRAVAVCLTCECVTIMWVEKVRRALLQSKFTRL